MATVITAAQFSIGAVDLSGAVKQISIEQSYADQDTTSMASGGRREHTRGIGDGTFTAELYQGWEALGVNATIAPMVGTVVEIIVLPFAGGTSATNPTYTFEVLVTAWTPISAAAGEVTMSSVSWPISGAVAITTA